jgi:hypothetical protein
VRSASVTWLGYPPADPVVGLIITLAMFGIVWRRMDPTVFPIISYALLSDNLSPVTLRDLARYRIAPLLSAIPGLAGVGVHGKRWRESGEDKGANW